MFRTEDVTHLPSSIGRIYVTHSILLVSLKYITLRFSQFYEESKTQHLVVTNCLHGVVFTCFDV